jgi:hypothetical protein
MASNRKPVNLHFKRFQSSDTVDELFKCSSLLSTTIKPSLSGAFKLLCLGSRPTRVMQQAALCRKTPLPVVFSLLASGILGYRYSGSLATKVNVRTATELPRNDVECTFWDQISGLHYSSKPVGIS